MVSVRVKNVHYYCPSCGELLGLTWQIEQKAENQEGANVRGGKVVCAASVYSYNLGVSQDHVLPRLVVKKLRR